VCGAGWLSTPSSPLRPIVYRELPRLAPRYLDTGYVLTDLLVGLVRQPRRLTAQTAGTGPVLARTTSSAGNNTWGGPSGTAVSAR